MPPVTGLHSSWRTSPSTSTPSSTPCPRPGLHNLHLFLFFWESLKGFLAHRPPDFACTLFPLTNLQIVSGHLSIWDLLLLELLELWSRWMTLKLSSFCFKLRLSLSASELWSVELSYLRLWLPLSFRRSYLMTVASNTYVTLLSASLQFQLC